MTVCESNPQLLSRVTTQYAVKGSSDWEAEIESGAYGAVVVCTPAPVHVPIGLKALRAGCHVLIEKPLSHSLAGVDDLLSAEKQSRATAAVAYVLHVAPWLVAARAFVQRGEIGAIRQVVFSAGQPFHRLRPGYAQSYYRDRSAGGGAIQDALTHSANWIESVIGPTDSLLCDCAHLALPEVEVEDTVHVAARNGEVLVSYALNQFQAPNESFYQFNSASGSVRIEPYQQRWGVLRAGETQWTWHSEPVADRDALFAAQANAFLDQVEGKPSRLCSLSAAAQTLRFNLAAIASASRGTRVRCQDLDV